MKEKKWKREDCRFGLIHVEKNDKVIVADKFDVSFQ